MKIIFLDVDGVLNHSKCNARVGSCILGISDRLVSNLATIVRATNAKIVLTSSWKAHWQRNTRSRDQESVMGKYLQNKLLKQKIYIFDKTKDYSDNRGEGIKHWLAKHKDVTKWVVLDDDIFPDYEEQGILPHLVKTDFYAGGLTESFVNQAIQMLNADVDR